MALVDTLRSALAPYLSVTLPLHQHAHECTERCPDPCPNVGKTWKYTPLKLPDDHVMLEWYTLPDGGRVAIDIHVEDLAAVLSAPQTTGPVTGPTSGVVSTVDTQTVDTIPAEVDPSTGMQKYLDKWRAEGLIT